MDVFVNPYVVTPGMHGSEQKIRFVAKETDLDLIGEGTRSETASNRRSASVEGVLEDGALSVGASRHDAHVGRILDGHDGSCGQEQLFPRLTQVQDVDSWENNQYSFNPGKRDGHEAEMAEFDQRERILPRELRLYTYCSIWKSR
jgi:hypothetical protein